MKPLLMMILLALGAHALAQEEAPGVSFDAVHVNTWNRFTESVYRLHQHLVKRGKTRTQSEGGGYGGADPRPDYYRQVEYYDAQTGQLLSRIRWEKANPNHIHVIEVYIYDDNGRLVRDYSSSYLPDHRNAPVQTLINFHAYQQDLHGFRQFDASGARVYEQCQGKLAGKSIFLSLEEWEIPSESEQSVDRVYQRCFKGLPLSAGNFLDPYRAETGS
jgi:hypothetical protein